MISRRSILWFGSLSLSLWCGQARAFGVTGHASVERGAYEILIEYRKGGPKVIQDLMSAGILRPPVAAATEDSLEHSYAGIAIRTQLPDHSMDRQLQSYGQCFHFMARAADVTDSVGKVNGMPERLVVDAYYRCMSLVDTLVRGILYDPAESQEHKLDIYALMHIIADTFSEAHVARAYDEKTVSIAGSYRACKEDDDKKGKEKTPPAACDVGKIAYLKPWRLRTAFPYLIHPSAWKYHFSESHHGILDSRDDDYLRDTEECRTQSQQGFVTKDCLSDEGLRSAYALADLLTILSRFVHCSQSLSGATRVNGPRTCFTKGKDSVESGLDSALSKFYREYLGHALAPDPDHPDDNPEQPIVKIDDQAHMKNLGGNTLFSSAQSEGRPPRDLGIALAFDMTADEPIWLTTQLFGHRDVMESSTFGLPDLSMTTLELRLPLQDSSGRRQVGAAFEWGIKLPIEISPSPDYRLLISARGRFEYTVSPIADNVTRHVVSPGFGGVALDLTILNMVWVGAEGPRCMFRYDTWLNAWNHPVCYWGAKVGGTFGEF